MGHKISKEQIDPGVKDHIMSFVGDVADLETEVNTDIISAVNSLMVDRVDNAENMGKIANAIGEPVTANHSVDEVVEGLGEMLSTFKTNMMNNGITVESGDKFKALIDKIATMVEEGSGKGIQYASGMLYTSGSTENFSTSSSVYYPGCRLEVNDLNFKPSVVFIFNDNDYNSKLNFFASTFNNDLVFNDITRPSNMSVSWYRGELNIEQTNCITPKITDNGFLLFTRISTANAPLTYHAFGVGEEDTTLRDSLASILQEEGVNVTEEDDMASLISKVDEEFDNRITMKTGTLNYTNGLVGENNNGKLIITHNLGTIPSYIVCRTSEMDYMPNDSSVGRSFTGSLCLTIDNSSYVTGNGNRATLSITDITENTFTVLTTMETSGRLSGWIEEWIVMK